MQHEISQPHVVLTTTQTLVALFVTIAGLVAGAWRIGRAMGEFSESQRGLTKEVREGFVAVNGTLEKHSKSIHDLRTNQQQFEIEHALLAQQTGFRRKEG